MRVAPLLVVGLAAAVLGSRAYPAEPTTFHLLAHDGRFDPPVLEVPAGQKFRIEIKNSGTDPIEFESKELRKEKVLAPGASSTLIFQPLAPGRYGFFDEFHMDTGKGEIVAR